MRNLIVAAVAALALAGCNLAQDEAVVAATVTALKGGARATPSSLQQAVDTTCKVAGDLNTGLAQAQATGAIKPTSSVAKKAVSGLAFIASVCGDGSGSYGVTASGVISLWETYKAVKTAVQDAGGTP